MTNIGKNITLTNNYKVTIAKLILLIDERLKKTLRLINRSKIDLYWEIAKLIIEQQKRFSWGEEVVEFLALDLQGRLYNIKGFSARNLWRMKRFYFGLSLLFTNTGTDLNAIKLRRQNSHQ